MRHRIREGRFGGVAPSLYPFSIGFGFSERKYRFSAPTKMKKSTFSIFFKLFAPRPQWIRHKSAKTTQNTHLTFVRSLWHTTTRIPRAIPWIPIDRNLKIHFKIHILRRGMHRRTVGTAPATHNLHKAKPERDQTVIKEKKVHSMQNLTLVHP